MFPPWPRQLFCLANLPVMAVGLDQALDGIRTGRDMDSADLSFFGRALPVLVAG